MKVSFVIPGKAIGKGRPKFFSGHAVTPQKTRNYESLVALKAEEVMKDLPDSRLGLPCLVRIHAYYAIPKSYSKKKHAAAIEGKLAPGKPDLDNITKSVLDGMNGIAFRDDSLVVEMRLKKSFTEGMERVEVLTEWRDEE